MGGNFPRHMEFRAVHQEARILRDCYSLKNQRKSHFFELIFITISLLIEENMEFYSTETKEEREDLFVCWFFCLPLFLNAVQVRVVLVVT